jgi:hypothetical protein
MHAKLSIYLNFTGVSIVRLRVLILGRRDAARRPASARLARVATQELFADFFVALYESFHLLVFVLLQAF